MTRFVRERFPARQSDVLNLYLRDQEFRELCHDFGVCATEIERLESSPATGASQRIGQLQELLDELEADIAERLNAPLTKPRRL